MQRRTLLDTILGPQPECVQLPLEPLYEATIAGAFTQSERGRNDRNAQLKMNWEIGYQKKMELAMCGDKPCNQADRRTLSLIYLGIGTDGRRIVGSRNPNLSMDILITVKIWRLLEESFIRPRNIAFDRYVLQQNSQWENQLKISLGN